MALKSLLDTQQVFAMYVAALITQAIALGYEVTIGDAYRDPRAFGAMGQAGAYGRDTSAHKQRLAIDLNLFKAGRYLATTDDHRALGEWWMRQHPLARWGGTFHTPDGNHYSFEYAGIS